MRHHMEIVEDLNIDPTDDPEFMQWFGNSVVKDDNGKPLILYHGSSSVFENFNTEMFWGSPDYKLASDYSNPRSNSGSQSSNVTPLFFKILAPFDANKLPRTVTIRHFAEELTKQAPKLKKSVIAEFYHEFEKRRHREESGPYYDVYDFWYPYAFGADAADYVKTLLLRLGFDGVVLTERLHDTYAVFRQDQVRSVFKKR